MAQEPEDHSASPPFVLSNSFLNPQFMQSSDARPLRILAEYVEPHTRFRRMNIRNTVVFFG